jgi:hypothetical protein
LLEGEFSRRVELEREEQAGEGDTASWKVDV